MGKGSGKTPGQLKVLLTKAVAAESQYAVAKKTGLALSVIQRFLKGDREPSTATLEKLSAFLNVPVHELRGEIAPLGVSLDALPEEYKALVTEVVAKLSDNENGGLYYDCFKVIVDISDQEALRKFCRRVTK